MGVGRVMRLAQRLYEGIDIGDGAVGLITYMRTDSVTVAAEALDELLPRADFVLVTVPHTPDTEGLFDESKFALMKPTSVFVNVGRGATTKLHDLDHALRQGTIGGAAVDVFEVEPLPEDHPICKLSALPRKSTTAPSGRACRCCYDR